MYQEQIKVLDALKASEDIAENMVLGQYEGYRQEPSVNEDSVTETYAAVRLFIDNDRWKGMPFYIRTGKKLGKREMQVAVVFKSPLPGLEPNILNIKIQPTEGVYLQFNIKKPGESDDTIQAKMDFCQSCSQINKMNTPEAYERLIGACILGNCAWFSQWDQIETSAAGTLFHIAVKKMFQATGNMIQSPLKTVAEKQGARKEVKNKKTNQDSLTK